MTHHILTFLMTDMPLVRLQAPTSKMSLDEIALLSTYQSALSCT
jgi:hypothetical protein